MTTLCVQALQAAAGRPAAAGPAALTAARCVTGGPSPAPGPAPVSLPATISWCQQHLLLKVMLQRRLATLGYTLQI